MIDADEPDRTADLLAVWYWEAFAAGERTRLAFELAYAPPRPPDRWIQKRSGEWPKLAVQPQHIVPCGHPKTYVNTKGALICEQCLTILGLFVSE